MSKVVHLIPVLFLLLATLDTSARELHLAEEDLVSVELATVAVVPGTNAPVVLLREPESGATVPIFIGPVEARAILLALRGVDAPRPMTHDLLGSVIASLSGTLESVVVDALQDNTYHGALEIRINADQPLIRVDSRPSDALALAARTGAHIRVAPDILIAGEGTDYESIGQDDEVVTALGITVVVATESLKSALSLPDKPGVVVTASEGLASYAGIQEGTLILRVNEQTVETPMQFLEKVSATPSGDYARLEYWQAGEEHTLELPTDVPERRRPGLSL